MDDKALMQDLLLTTKGVCDLYLHGAIESATANVRGAFDGALDDSLKMQADLYQKMAAKGWYPSQQADSQQISQVKQKFSSCC
ncbi:MAG: spore coat protein [Acutalibacteraceae bacterium]|jgi:spore coat protein CotF